MQEFASLFIIINLYCKSLLLFGCQGLAPAPLPGEPHAAKIDGAAPLFARP